MEDLTLNFSILLYSGTEKDDGLLKRSKKGTNKRKVVNETSQRVHYEINIAKTGCKFVLRIFGGTTRVTANK